MLWRKRCPRWRTFSMCCNQQNNSHSVMNVRYLKLGFITIIKDIQMVQAEKKSLKYKNIMRLCLYSWDSLLAKSDVTVIQSISVSWFLKANCVFAQRSVSKISVLNWTEEQTLVFWENEVRWLVRPLWRKCERYGSLMVTFWIRDRPLGFQDSGGGT